MQATTTTTTYLLFNHLFIHGSLQVSTVHQTSPSESLQIAVVKFYRPDALMACNQQCRSSEEIFIYLQSIQSS